MLDLTTAIAFEAEIESAAGASEPLLVRVMRQNQTEESAYIKLTDKLPLKFHVIEAMTSMLARDLELPIPEPLLVKLAPEFINAVDNTRIANRLRNSTSPVFGCVALPNGYAVTNKQLPLNGDCLQTAGRIFIFDALIDNLDRGGPYPQKTNCLIRGGDLAIIDHEKCFSTASAQFLFGQQNPWELGGLERFKTPGSHLFVDALRGQFNNLNLNSFVTSLSNVVPTRINDYINAMPSEWVSEIPCARKVGAIITSVQENIQGCMTEIERVLQ